MDAFNHIDIDMDVFDEISFDKIKNEFYLLAINDMSYGLSVEDMANILKQYEEMEWYAACAGIKEAIEEMNTINQIIKM